MPAGCRGHAALPFLRSPASRRSYAGLPSEQPPAARSLPSARRSMLSGRCCGRPCEIHSTSALCSCLTAVCRFTRLPWSTLSSCWSRAAGSTPAGKVTAAFSAPALSSQPIGTQQKPAPAKLQPALQSRVPQICPHSCTQLPLAREANWPVSLPPPLLWLPQQCQRHRMALPKGTAAFPCHSLYCTANRTANRALPCSAGMPATRQTTTTACPSAGRAPWRPSTSHRSCGARAGAQACG